jgi:multidrug resistance efflux pump
MGRLRSFSGPGFGHFFELVRGESGVVRAIDVVDGAHVEAGQVLVELDCEPLRMEIDVRAASLAAAVAVYKRVVNGPRPEEIAIGEAGVGVALARADEARATLDRAHGLEVGISITLAQLLVAERDSRIADAVLVDARKKLTLFKVGSRARAKGVGRPCCTLPPAFPLLRSPVS